MGDTFDLPLFLLIAENVYPAWKKR